MWALIMTKLGLKDLAKAMRTSKVAAEQAWLNKWYPALLALQGKGVACVTEAIIQQQAAWERDDALEQQQQEQQQQQQEQQQLPRRSGHEVAVLSVVAHACGCAPPQGPLHLAGIVPPMQCLPEEVFKAAVLDLYSQDMYHVVGCALAVYSPRREYQSISPAYLYGMMKASLFAFFKGPGRDDFDYSCRPPLKPGRSAFGDLTIERLLSLAQPSSVRFPSLIKKPLGAGNAALHIITYCEEVFEVFDSAASLLGSDMALVKATCHAVPREAWAWLLERRRLSSAAGAGSGAAAAAAAAAPAAAAAAAGADVPWDIVEAVMQDPLSCCRLWPCLAKASPAAMAEWVRQNVPRLVRTLLHTTGANRMLICQALVAVLDAEAVRPLLEALWVSVHSKPNPGRTLLDRQRTVMCNFAEHYGEPCVEAAAQPSGGVPAWFGQLRRGAGGRLHSYNFRG
jgi:hypothetical protein